MKRIFCTAAIVAASAMSLGAAPAIEPIGDWMVRDGLAHIRIQKCADKLWGFIAWEKQAGLDVNNPDPAKRSKPMLGMPILRAMKQTEPNKWEGEVYNSQDGKMYSANISLRSPDVLKLEGCVLGGWFCGGEDWSRVKAPEPPTASVPPQTKSAKGTKSTPQVASAPDFCSSVAEGPRPAHKDGLK